MDTIFRISLVLICAGSMCVTYNCLVGWLTRVEGKLNLNLIRNSALRIEQYYRMRKEIEKEDNNKEALELIDRLIEQETDFGMGKEEVDKIVKLSREKK